MKANELRIGNWYHWYAFGKNYEYQVEAIDLIQNYKNFEPIPLTEEWLIRFGFEGTEFMIAKGNFIYHKGNKTLTWFGVMLLNSLWDEVHKFQNLHFALTGEELELK
jgi:hypothetical protein